MAPARVFWSAPAQPRAIWPRFWLANEITPPTRHITGLAPGGPSRLVTNIDKLPISCVALTHKLVFVSGRSVFRRCALRQRLMGVPNRRDQGTSSIRVPLCLPDQDDAVDGGSAQIPGIRQRLSERAKSTRCCPSRSSPGTEGMRT
jgi:hypothetical protein